MTQRAARVTAPGWAAELIPCPECRAASGSPCRSGGRDGGRMHPMRRKLADDREAGVLTMAGTLERHRRVGLRSCACGADSVPHELHLAREVASWLARQSSPVVRALSMDFGHV